MQSHWHHTKARRNRGQILLLSTFCIVALVAFVGLGLDIGFAYITKAQLSKAVDAAALTGVRNLSQGDAQAISVVQSAFAMNYGRPGRDTGPVTPTATIVTDAASNTRRFQVGATATINTFFIRIFPAFRTLTVHADAEAIRSRVVMSVILDKSGSMAQNGGCSALPWATDTFIDMFDDNIDKAALITFSSVANTLVTMRRPFKQPIKNAVPRSCNLYSGATFMQDGLQQGYTQINTEPVTPGDNVLRVAVFFTDGLANIIQESVRCESAQATNAWNFGGSDTSATSYFVINATSGTVGNFGMPPSDCDNPGLKQFTLVNGGVQTKINMDTIRAEAQDRTLNLANQMRNAGIIVYTIGLGSGVDKPFLRDLANTSDAPDYNPNQMSGIAAFPATPADINNAFQIIASDILGRLTR